MEILEVIKFHNAIFTVTFTVKSFFQMFTLDSTQYIFKLVLVKSVFRSYYILTGLI